MGFFLHKIQKCIKNLLDKLQCWWFHSMHILIFLFCIFLFFFIDQSKQRRASWINCIRKFSGISSNLLYSEKFNNNWLFPILSLLTNWFKLRNEINVSIYLSFVFFWMVMNSGQESNYHSEWTKLVRKRVLLNVLWSKLIAAYY